MTKDEIARLVKYQNLLKEQLAQTVSKKHLHRVRQLKEFLQKDLNQVTNKIEAQKLEATK